MQLKKSKFYERIMKSIGDDKVKLWEFDIKNKDIYHQVVRGRGDIKWDILEDVINALNKKYPKNKILLRFLFDDFADTPLTGKVILENGDYILIQEKYFSYDDVYALGVERFKVPKIEIEEDSSLEIVYL